MWLFIRKRLVGPGFYKIFQLNACIMRKVVDWKRLVGFGFRKKVFTQLLVGNGWRVSEFYNNVSVQCMYVCIALCFFLSLLICS